MTPYQLSAAILHYAVSCFLMAFASLGLALLLAVMLNLRGKR